MNTPRLTDVAPELVAELRELLLREGEDELAVRAAEVRIVDLCRCDDHFCASFYTAPRPPGAFGPGHRTIALDPESGYLNVDVVGPDIVQIEVLYRDDLRSKIHAATG